jgi:hypothetical protein
MPCICTFEDDDSHDGPDGPEISYPPPSRLVHINLLLGAKRRRLVGSVSRDLHRRGELYTSDIILSMIIAMVGPAPLSSNVK